MSWIDIREKEPEYGDRVIAVGTWWGEITDISGGVFMGMGDWSSGHVVIDSDTYSTWIINIVCWTPAPPIPKALPNQTT